MEPAAAAAAAHVLVFPWPLQGHINCMHHLATALLDAGLHVTFLHTHHNLRRLATKPAPAPSQPRLRLLSIPDGLPEDHPRSVAHLNDLMDSMRTTGSAAYRALLLASSSNKDGHPPVTCVIADGVMAFAVDVAEEVGVPAIAFRTASACSFLTYLSVRRLVELGEFPFPSDQPVSGVPGMEGFLRRRDLPRAPRPAGSATDDCGVDPMLLNMGECTVHSGEARALILNTSASMEGPALAQIAPHMRDVFSVGPLHVAAGTGTKSTAPTASLWREDDGCMAWLDGQQDRSVVYVSLGSLTVISEEQLAEFLSGLAATGYAFLWVLRPDMVAGGTTSLAAVKTLVGEKARVVHWAPQRDVLRHPAVGCFLTHAGWNSTLEAAYEGVPMVCWTFFGDQLINSRFVDTVWQTGVDIKDVCDRAVVEKAVREAMESAQIRAAAQAMARQLRLDVADGGSSSSEIKRLVAFIRDLL
uniref:UDP-glycosyltransferase UGT709A10 n=1 Tax=Avena strigosa TaxID=38783 RepID=C4MF39_9POAL|nr:UDP-glycosyltransferase UGT709A10 [Avena strigosa]